MSAGSPVFAKTYWATECLPCAKRKFANCAYDITGGRFAEFKPIINALNAKYNGGKAEVKLPWERAAFAW